MTALLQFRHDVICIQDIRLGSGNIKLNIDRLNEFFQHTQYGRYDIHFNSSKNKRGVAFLIRAELDIKINQIYKDDSENCLCLHTTYEGKDLILCNIYGPNRNDSEFFNEVFSNIRNWMLNSVDPHIVIMGDFNCITSLDDPSHNIDLLKSSTIPNRQNSEIVIEWMSRLDIYDCQSPNFRQL